MKQAMFTVVAMITITGLFAQPHVGIYVQEAKDNPVKSQDVRSIGLLILGPDSLREVYFERFDGFTITNGLVYLEIGHGTPGSWALSR